MTVINPINQMVGDGPIENIIRSIIDATNVRIPDGRGTVNTLAIDKNIIVQINADKCEFNSVWDKNKRKKLEFNYSNVKIYFEKSD